MSLNPWLKTLNYFIFTIQVSKCKILKSSLMRLANIANKTLLMTYEKRVC